MSKASNSDKTLLPDTEIPEAFVRWSIAEEQVHSLADLAERRLMLLYRQKLSRDCLHRLAELLVESGRLDGREVDSAVKTEAEYLMTRYGKAVR